MDPREQELADLRRLDQLMSEKRAASAPASDNLGGTLQLGIPYTQARFNTGIPMPQSLDAAMVSAGNATDRILKGIKSGLGFGSPELDAQVRQNAEAFKPLDAQFPVASALGSALPAMAVPVGAAATVPAALGKAALAGAIPGLLEYGDAGERLQRGAAGAAGGLAGGALGLGIGRVLNPVRGQGPAYINEITGLANKFDYPLTAGQATGSKPLQYIESAASNMVGGAGRMANVAQAQRDSITRAAVRGIGSDAERFTPEVVSNALDTSWGKINDLTGKFDVPVNEALVSKLANVESRYMARLPSQQKPIVGRYIDEIMSAGDSIPGATYQGIRADLGADVAGAKKGSFKGALKGIQKALDDGFKDAADSATNDALALARQQYAAGKKLEGLATATGDISGPRIANAAKGMPGDLGDLAKLTGMVKPLPDSGTAQRSFWMNAFNKPIHESLSPANLWALTGVPWLAANATTRGPAKQYLTRGLLSMNPEREAELIKYFGPLGLAGANALLPR